MERGRHRDEPVRRPRRRQLVVLAVVGTLLAAVPALDLGPTSGADAAVPQASVAGAAAVPRASLAEVIELRTLEASSRGGVRSTTSADAELYAPVPQVTPSVPPPAPEVEERSAVASVVSDSSCSISAGIEASLTDSADAVYRAVCAAYGGSVSSFGGYRAGDSGDHGSGRAVDIMVSGEPGWEIARYVQAHADELGVAYVIYEQQIWMIGDSADAWELMSDRGSATANHFDHVHVSVT